MTGGEPLVGRQPMLQQVIRTLSRAGSGGVVLVGDSGVGKTRIAREALRQVERRGAATAWSVATDAASSIPYGALVELLPEPATRPLTAPLDVLLRTVEAVRGRRTARGFVLGVDDAHLLDDASAALVHHLARTGTCRVLATVRAGEPAPDAVAALWVSDLAERTDVPPLSRRQTLAVAADLLGGTLHASTTHRLWQLSRGNPLLLRELVSSGLETGALADVGGVWTISGELGEGRRVQELVTARLHRLDDEARDAAEVTALGEPLEVALLEAICGEQTLNDLERRGVLTVTEDRQRARVWLAHPLYGEVLRARVPPLRSRSINRRLADALSTSGSRRSEDLLRLARWRLESGTAPEPSLLLLAARRALALGDIRLGVRLSHAAAGDGTVEALLVAAEALQAAGRPAEAEKVLRPLQARTHGDLAARVALMRATGLVAAHGRAAEASGLVDEALEQAEDPGTAGELVAFQALLALNEGRVAEAAVAAGQVLARPGAPPAARLRALLVAVPAWAHAGRTQDAIRAARGALELLRVTPDAPAALSELVRLGLCLAHGLAGSYDDAEELADRQHVEALEHVADELRAVWTAALGHLALARGRLRSSAELLKEATRLLQAHPTGFGVYSLAWCYGCLAEASAVAGDLAGARAAMSAADAATPEPCFIANRELGRVWVTAAAGGLSDAADMACSLAEESAQLGNVSFAVTALHDAARLGAASRVADRLGELAATVDGALGPLYARHAFALVAGDADELEAVSNGMAEVGRMLLASEAAAEASERHDRSGCAGRADAAATRARMLAERCQGPRTPALALGLPGRPLTVREHEVAALASTGLSSREIAERLVISARTVDNHLQRVYDKLGVRGRGQLGAALGQLGLRPGHARTPWPPVLP